MDIRDDVSEVPLLRGGRTQLRPRPPAFPSLEHRPDGGGCARSPRQAEVQPVGLALRRSRWALPRDEPGACQLSSWHAVGSQSGKWATTHTWRHCSIIARTDAHCPPDGLEPGCSPPAGPPTTEPSRGHLWELQPPLRVLPRVACSESHPCPQETYLMKHMSKHTVVEHLVSHHSPQRTESPGIPVRISLI